jgi:hypothetical protein
VAGRKINFDQSKIQRPADEIKCKVCSDKQPARRLPSWQLALRDSFAARLACLARHAMLLDDALASADFLTDYFFLHQDLFVSRALALGAYLAVAAVMVKQAAQRRQLFEAVRDALDFIDGLFDLLFLGHELATVRDAFARRRLLGRYVRRSVASSGHASKRK